MILKPSAFQAWVSNLAQISGQLARQDSSFRAMLDHGQAAADQARRLIDRLQPTLPIVPANLTSLTNVAVVYRDNLEQLLVLSPRRWKCRTAHVARDMARRPSTSERELTREHY
jgi:ABC-type transporter Mla subunit MlaD